MIVEGAVELGALGERNDQAGFAGMEIAQVVELADVFVALAVRWRRAAMAEQLVGGLAHGGDDHDGMAVLRGL